ncbi:MAG TPA: hypothetical protein VLE69_01425 [Candidatus Saccharimonadales bacterium]|nr:hypothetical protein [Candidatus Saccharimonadales bacterium]
MAELSECFSSQEQYPIGLEVVNALRTMTDSVLVDAGFAQGDDRISPVVEFMITKPHRQYGLKLYSIADGYGGFNTFSDLRDGEDNSRRWAVSIDRGTNFGAAFDNKGTVYEHGGYQDVWFSLDKQTIDTGTITELVYDFYDNPDGVVTFRFLHNLEDRTVPPSESTEPRLLHLIPVEDEAEKPTKKTRKFLLLRRLLG